MSLRKSYKKTRTTKAIQNETISESHAKSDTGNQQQNLGKTTRYAKAMQKTDWEEERQRREEAERGAEGETKIIFALSWRKMGLWRSFGEKKYCVDNVVMTIRNQCTVFKIF